jgi:dihydrofolate reductase
MRKLVESTVVTLDGVISDTIPSTAPQASPEEWGGPYWDDEHFNYAQKLLFAADALVLARVTYEGFAASWPQRSGDEFSDRINRMPKYVASRTLKEASWNSTILKGDVADAVRGLKSQGEGTLLKYGTGELDRALMQGRLVDEFHFWFFPVAVGAGQRLFDGIEPGHLKLLESTRFKSGIVVNVYGPK